MKKLSLLLIIFTLSVSAFANDGVYYTSGNQLIPIIETDIQVKKELLLIRRVKDHLVVRVRYEFFNPAEEKDLLVGFEAPGSYPPQKSHLETFPEQPHIRDFKVMVNGKPLTYEIAHVPGSMYIMDGKLHDRSDYYQNGRFHSLTKHQCEDSLLSLDYPSFYYVYHFNAHFKKGTNLVEHTYEYDLSHSVAEEFHFKYILSAANRWANNGIDDFTLSIHMGEHESFAIKPTFFTNSDNWVAQGAVRKNDIEIYKEPMAAFHVQKGTVVFHKKNFHPEGELEITKHNMIDYLWQATQKSNNKADDILKNMQEQYFTLDFMQNLIDMEGDKTIFFSKAQKNILANMPYAYRGYVFSDKKLQSYFESSKWYLPNPNYQKEPKSLSKTEQKWIDTIENPGQAHK